MRMYYSLKTQNKRKVSELDELNEGFVNNANTLYNLNETHKIKTRETLTNINK